MIEFYEFYGIKKIELDFLGIFRDPFMQLRNNIHVRKVSDINPRLLSIA